MHAIHLDRVPWSVEKGTDVDGDGHRVVLIGVTAISEQEDHAMADALRMALGDLVRRAALIDLTRFGGDLKT